MKRLVRKLSSLKLAVALLLLLLGGLAGGTIVESSQGAEAAGRLVYYAWWFIALEAAFAVNVACSVAYHYPFGRARIGFVVTHGSLLLVLAGAMTTWLFKAEGHLQLWEGETGDRLEDRDHPGRSIALPFSVKLEKFQVQHYPGMMMPAGFRSDVQIIENGRSFPAAIWMNHELSHGGWKLFQSSYRQEGGRSATVLSVSRDPGQPIAFAGYIILLLGMSVVLATRAAQTRQRAINQAHGAAAEVAQRPAPAKGGKKPRPQTAGATAALLALLLSGAAQAGERTEVLRRLPVQHDGRVMPLDTVAREAVFKITGRSALNGADPVDTLLWWMFDPESASNAAVIDVGSSELAAKVNLPPGPAAFDQLVSNKELLSLFETARKAAAEERPRQGVLAAAEKLEARLVKMQALLQRDELRAIPVADPMGKWNVAPAKTVEELIALATGPRLAGWSTPAAIEREFTYNAVHPVRLSWMLLLGALGLSLLAWSGRRVWADRGALILLVAGFAVMTWGIAIRWVIGDRVPAANMYESLLFLAWGVGLIAVLAYAVLRSRLVVLNASAMALMTLLMTDLLPIDGFIHPVPPVLAGTPWLAIHVPIIMVSYSVLALGMVIAHMQLGYTIFAPHKKDSIARMGELLYWYILVGSTLLIAGILTGSMWASSSWGRYWGWDPKEVWSLIAFLGYMAILHARWDKLLDSFRVAAVSIVAFQTVLMTYLGVNFVLTTGLHSYGMGDSPVVFWMAVTALTEAAFVVVAWRSQRQQEQALQPG